MYTGVTDHLIPPRKITDFLWLSLEKNVNTICGLFDLGRPTISVEAVDAIRIQNEACFLPSISGPSGWKLTIV